MKLFTIGDSVSQGFMSFAAARTDLSYSTLVAQSLGDVLGKSYKVADWPLGGHPANLERIFRRLNKFYGADIAGPFEWGAALYNIASMLDDVEDYYERGPGDELEPGPSDNEYYHNVSVRGFNVADAWMVTPKLCKQRIDESNRDGGGDGWFSTANASIFRTALEVLNPTRKKSFDQMSALAWLEHHATTEGVENCIVWLGSNNALGPILSLDIKLTPNRSDWNPVQSSYQEREKYNLWRPEHFEIEFVDLMDRIHKIMEKNKFDDWKVFVGTTPAVTVAPLAKGVGDTQLRNDPFGTLGSNAQYYQYYTYFPFDKEFAEKGIGRLTLEQVYFIDSTIAQYNKSIKKTVKALNGSSKTAKAKKFILVDTSDALLKIAFKRNNGQPLYKFPAYFESLGRMPNTKYYHADPNGKLVQGGLFSLDGVHPTAIGHGLMAHEFLKRMKDARGNKIKVTEPDWDRVFASDKLWTRPISLMQEVYQHDKLAEMIMRFCKAIC